MLSKFFNLYIRYFWSETKIARYKGVEIGKNSIVTGVSFGSEPYLISIGDNVRITDGTKIFTHGGARVLRKKHPDLDFFGKVDIGNNVYIGNNCLIMPGVKIGSNVIVGAGSVVTKSIKDNTIVGGNPARFISNIEEFESKVVQKNLKTKGMSYIAKKEFLMSLPDEKFIQK